MYIFWRITFWFRILAERERQVFNRIVQQQLKEAQREKEHDKCRHRANLQHAQDIRAQIRNREQV